MRPEDDKTADRLVNKMTAPPLDPFAVEEYKPNSYDKLSEVAEDIFAEGQKFNEKWDKRGSDLWKSVGKK